jgi:hypothetical protein
VLDLKEESLHGSLQDPMLGLIESVKEVVVRFSDAISFALGSPLLGIWTR